METKIWETLNRYSLKAWEYVRFPKRVCRQKRLLIMEPWGIRAFKRVMLSVRRDKWGKSKEWDLPGREF